MKVCLVTGENQKPGETLILPTVCFRNEDNEDNEQQCMRQNM